MWVAPASLTVEEDTIRGMATKTKTTVRGMPFAFLTYMVIFRGAIFGELVVKGQSLVSRNCRHF